jgi:hypothetical protein
MFHRRFNSAMRARADPAGGRTCRAMLTRLLAIGPPSRVLIRWTGEDERQHFAAPRAFRRHERSSDPRGEPTPAWRRQDFTERAFRRHLRGSRPRPGVARTLQNERSGGTYGGAIPGLASPGLYSTSVPATLTGEPTPAWRRQDFTDTGPTSDRAKHTGGSHSRPGVARTSQTRAQRAIERNTREGAIPGLASPGLHRHGPQSSERAKHTGGSHPQRGCEVLASPGLQRHGPNERAREHTGGSHSRPGFARTSQRLPKRAACNTYGGQSRPGAARTSPTRPGASRTSQTLAQRATHGRSRSLPGISRTSQRHMGPLATRGGAVPAWHNQDLTTGHW